VAIPRLLDALLRAHGPTGHEHLAFDAVREGLAGVGRVETDAIGNLIVRADGESERPKLALFAHLDVVGLAVSHIADDGLLSVHTLVPAPAAVAYGQRVEIRAATGGVPGVIARRSSDKDKIEWSNLYVDIGARSAKEARALVAEGDPMVMLAPPVELAAGRIASRSLDNRAGVYVALEAFRRLGGEGIVVVAAAHEELGGHGAQVASHRLRPEVALALDVTYANDVPAGDVHDAGAHSLGGGPAIFRGPAIHPRVFELLVDAAHAEGIAHTVEAGSKTATDADSVFASRDGIPTGVVSIPLRNMHSPIEIAELADLEATISLVVAFAGLLEPGASYAR
jgi:putative aminopeptidase FrvX